jgi:hypothetical protein
MEDLRVNGIGNRPHLPLFVFFVGRRLLITFVPVQTMYISPHGETSEIPLSSGTRFGVFSHRRPIDPGSMRHCLPCALHANLGRGGDEIRYLYERRPPFTGPVLPWHQSLCGGQPGEGPLAALDQN